MLSQLFVFSFLFQSIFAQHFNSSSSADEFEHYHATQVEGNHTWLIVLIVVEKFGILIFIVFSCHKLLAGNDPTRAELMRYQMSDKSDSATPSIETALGIMAQRYSRDWFMELNNIL